MASNLWKLRIIPADYRVAGSRDDLFGLVRPQLARHLTSQPGSREYSLKTALGTVLAEQVTGATGGEITFELADAAPLKPTAASHVDGLHTLHLPDERLTAQSAALVGVDDIYQEAMQFLALHFDGILEDWASATGTAVPAAMRDHVTSAIPFVLLLGGPGVGKTMVANCLANDFVSKHPGLSGTILTLRANRGNGLVGNLAATLSGAFLSLLKLPRDTFRVLILEEADTWLLPRHNLTGIADTNHRASHVEDHAAVTAVASLLDSLRGERVLVIACSNADLDPAIVRRAQTFRLTKPKPGARGAFLDRWVPELTGRDRNRCIKASDGMSPWDMERVLVRVWKICLAGGRPINVGELVHALRTGERTPGV